MRKPIIGVLAVLLFLVGAFFTYEYVTDSKIVDGGVSKTIDDKGKPEETTKEFTPEDTIYFSAKANRFWIKKAEVVWYKGEIATANRLLVEEEIDVNDAGYFTAKLSLPEGIEEGYYNVTIYVHGKNIKETHAEFNVKK
ncbi:hypothetical protein ACTHQ4_20810 [Alkalicoccobacillus gibsonii]|uniref:hypothetical protein n=1 Tax=Alkalicoccobacillus gibsonii TaxID=79881 RepID=UPI003F7B5218